VSYSAADTQDQERTLGEIRGQLDHARFSASWAAGESMTIDEAIAYAGVRPGARAVDAMFI
jgi:hypothetical protein